jgi:microsomal epoxide hydrolase
MAGGRSFTAPEPFTVSVPEADLDYLRARLRNARWPGDAGNTDGSYGVRKAWLQDLVRYWAEEYD